MSGGLWILVLLHSSKYVCILGPESVLVFKTCFILTLSLMEMTFLCAVGTMSGAEELGFILSSFKKPVRIIWEIFQRRGKRRKTQALNSIQYSSSTPSAMVSQHSKTTSLCSSVSLILLFNVFQFVFFFSVKRSSSQNLRYPLLCLDWFFGQDCL